VQLGTSCSTPRMGRSLDMLRLLLLLLLLLLP
jgi:hypothetical protein